MVQEKLGQDTKLWQVTHCIFGCFHNSSFHFDYFKITSSHLIHRWYKLPFFSTSSHQNQKIPAHVCVFHVSSSWILPCCCFTGIVPQPKQWSFFLMPMSEARSRFQLFCLFVCLSLSFLKVQAFWRKVAAPTEGLLLVCVCLCLFIVRAHIILSRGMSRGIRTSRHLDPWWELRPHRGAH